MPVYKINVKWQKEKFGDVECDTDQPPEVFKALLYSLSGVPPDRQKIMMSGGVLQDSWDRIKLKNGITAMMMGTTEVLPTAPPSQPTKFIEDMDDSEINQILELPPGLNNLGNTCYMNATIQCLYSIPELRESLSKLQRTPSAGINFEQHSLVVHMRDLFTQMSHSGETISPAIFLAWMHNMFPRFATRASGGEGGMAGGFQQQDANECWTELVNCIQKVMMNIPCPRSALVDSSDSTAQQIPSINFVDKLMSGQLECKLTCDDAPDEEPSISTEQFYQITCYIDKETKYMQSGLRASLEGTLEKQSPTLGKAAIYKKVSKIKRLPSYLSIQFVRFNYKVDKNINAKVLKDVKFPLSLDMYEFCSSELQEKLVPMRDKFKQLEDRLADEAVRRKRGDIISSDKKNEKNEPKYAPHTFPNDPGSNNSGFYELQAVLTHQGRSSSSGHYVAWVRRKDEWYKFDDDIVSPVTSEDILRLSGGGDWHCAYILLYGPRRLQILPDSTSDGETVKDQQVNQAHNDDTKMDL